MNVPRCKIDMHTDRDEYANDAMGWVNTVLCCDNTKNMQSFFKPPHAEECNFHIHTNRHKKVKTQYFREAEANAITDSAPTSPHLRLRMTQAYTSLCYLHSWINHIDISFDDTTDAFQP